jgi:hypothetical protein
MFREAALHQVHDTQPEPVWPVLTRRAELAVVVPTAAGDTPPFRAAPAVPDVPAAAGVMLFMVYMALIGSLALATAGPGQSGFVLVIAALFVVAFFAVPRFILGQEPQDRRRVTVDEFLGRGLDTFTGHCTGGAALVQMFVVPVLLTLGMLLIATVIAFVG